MSKLLFAAAATGVTSTSATAVYGAYYASFLSSIKEQIEGKYDGLYIDKIKEGFKSNNGKCMEHTFSKGSESSYMKNAAENKDAFSLDKTSPTVGCLAFNGDKENPRKNWVESNFRLVGTLAKGNKGFAVYVSGTVKEKNIMKWEGITYVLEKKNDAWQATQKLDLKKDTLSDWKKYFPQAGNYTDFTHKKFNNNYWDFLDNGGTKMRDVDHGELYYQYQHWQGRSGFNDDEDYDELKLWSPNLSEWGKYFFDDGKKWDMYDVIKDINGIWN